MKTFCGVKFGVGSSSAGRARHAQHASDAEEMAIVLGLAVLLSPIAWDHYWVLFFPAFLLALVARERVPGPLLPRVFFPAHVTQPEQQTAH